jgi:hypothetical protein
LKDEIYIFEEERIIMKDEATRYLILGVVFLAVGITMLMTHAVSSVIAYGDIVLAIVFFVFSARAGKTSKDDKKDD